MLARVLLGWASVTLRANLAAVVLPALLLAGAAVSLAKDARSAALPERYRQWLDEVQILISDEEREAFLALERDYQRDGFIRRFWEARNPEPGSPHNRFKDRYYARRAEAFDRFGGLRDERTRYWILHGEPGDVFETGCALFLWPLEIWYYGYAELLGRELRLIFYQPSGGGPFKLWRPGEGYKPLVAMWRRDVPFAMQLRQYCRSLERWQIEALLERIEEYEFDGPTGPLAAGQPPPILDPEWLRTFAALSTDVPESATPLTPELSVRFSGRHRQRVVVEGRLELPRAEARTASLAGRESFNFQVTGEVLRADALFETFRYRFDLPVRGEPPERLGLLFERYLRPGEYRLVLKLEDLNGSGMARLERDLAVPAAVGEEAGAAADEAGAEVAAAPPALEEEPEVELLSEGVDLVSGLARFTAAVSGTGIRKVRFLLDGRPILTKTRPPYSVELDLGSLPATRRVRVVALDASGAELATDEVVVNPGEHVFAVRLIEPRRGAIYSDSVRARAEVQVPEGSRLERVEFYLEDARVASLFQEPFIQSIPLTGDGLAFVRVVARLADGNSTEDLVVFNTPQYLEDVQVRYVEVFATVLDRAGRPLTDLGREAFRVLENGREQEILRFERIDDLPIYAGVLLDTSASMRESLAAVREAALGFFAETILPRDRAAVITFADKPRLAARFTADHERLAGALAGVKAESTTALYDSLMFALYYFRGVKGQRALVVLSDGEDRRSESSFDEVLGFARTAGVTVYTIGLKGDKGGAAGRSQLTRLAEETGGRAFFIRSAEELDAIYAVIQGDLRSRYLLAYQSSNTEGSGLRTVEVRVARPDVEVRALRGYVP